MNYTVGYAIVSTLSLALLIPLANDPLLDNYILVLYAAPLYPSWRINSHLW